MIGYRLVSALGVGLSLLACSGRVGVGFEPIEDEGTAGAGDVSGAGTGATASGGSSGVTGQAGASTSAGGPGTGTGGVCNFSPGGVGDDTRPLLSSADVLARIYLFLDNDPTIPAGALPPEPTASWAAARAKAILDGHAAAGTPAPGLERFLSKWLAIHSDVATIDLQSPGRFALKLVEPDATLTTLLAEPGEEPHRLGILTDPEFLSAYSSIARRGVWMSANLLCRQVPPPPPDLAFSVEEGEGTHRQKYEAVVSQAVCTGCHRIMDPPGFSLEHFDGAGNYRELDNGLPVDASSSMSEPAMSFDDYSELAPQLATSCEVAQCFTRLVATDAFGQALHETQSPLSEAELNRAAESFASGGYSIRVLVDSIVRSPSFLR